MKRNEVTMAQMTPQVSELLEKALALSSEERGQLIDRLVESLDDEPAEPGVEAAWDEEIKRRVAKLKGEFIQNTGLRFRVQTLHARFIAYERMWLRSAREKEDGTYRRDLLRLRRHAAASAKAAAASAKPADAPPTTPAPPPVAAARPAEPPAPAAAEARSPAPPPEGDEAQLRALYSAWVDAKKRCNEDVSRLTYEALARTISKQVPDLMARYKARSIEFKVVIKDGRVVLKALPRL